MHFSTDKQNPIIIHGNSTVELPKTQVSDKSETTNNFISISLKILSFTVAMLIFAHIFVTIYGFFCTTESNIKGDGYSEQSSKYIESKKKIT